MMRFPPRLKWDLARARIARELFASSRRPLLLLLNLADFAAQTEPRAFSSGEVPTDANAEPLSSLSSRDSQVPAQVRENAAPIVWIGGDTPLSYPRIGHLAREIINLGRTVFIETDGTLLRRRIHEFRPVSRLYLVLPLNGLEAAHDQRAQHPGNFRATIESIRTAKLSGFHICVETTIFSDTELTELHKLAEFIQKLDIDGWIQTRPPVSAANQPSEEKLTVARTLIPNHNWRKFSEHLPLLRILPEHSPLGAPHAGVGSGAHPGLWVAPLGETLTSQERGALAPEGRANVEGKVGSAGSDSPNQDLPAQQESVRAL